ncbi:hypothetical protein R1sor_014239 [Riccia sorocarpa]|uniref:FCP1 homology domain-containing protein n=1 Tax=Riccia sorocarpa TaxID=122646 RepID=A0ABD3H8T8_9MARC
MQEEEVVDADAPHMEMQSPSLSRTLPGRWRRLRIGGGGGGRGGRPLRPLRRRRREDNFSEDEEEEKEEPEAQEGAKPRRQVRENPLPEGPYRVSWIPIIHRSRYIRWGYLTSEAVYDAAQRITWGEFVHCGFGTILSSDMHPPISCCMEFITSFNHSTSVEVLRGHRIRIDDDLGLIAESIRRECAFIQTHFERTQERAPEKRRFAETFIGIPLTWIFLHLELVTEAECEAGAVVPDGGFPLPGGDDSSSEDGDSTHRDEAPSETVDRDILMDELTMLRQQSDSLHAKIASLRKMGLRQPLLSPSESRFKTLVLDIFGLFVCVCRTHSDREVAASMGYTVHHLIHPQRSAAIYYVVRGELNLVLDTLVSVAEVIIWTSRSRGYTQLILEDMENEHLIPEGLTKCDRVWPSRLERGKLTPMKDFRRFYDMRVCTRDVLLVDVEVAHNSPNHPFSAVHPWPFGLGTLLADHHDYVMDRLVPWLTEWSVDSSPTHDFVQSQRTRIDGADPIEGLRRFWGQQPFEANRSIIWRSVSRADGLVLAGLWPAVFGDVRPGDRPCADIVGSVVGDPSPGPISADLLAGALDVMLSVSRAEGSVGPTADPLVDSGNEGGAEGSVGAVADPLPEPVVVSGAEGSVGAVADPLPEPVVDTGTEGSVGPIPDLSALQIAHTVAELDAEGTAPEQQRVALRRAAELSNEQLSSGVESLGVTMAHIPMTGMNRALLSELKAMSIVFIGHNIPALKEGRLDRVNSAIRELEEFVLPSMIKLCHFREVSSGTDS